MAKGLLMLSFAALWLGSQAEIMQCNGGSEGGCKCLLECKVFKDKGDPDSCSDKTKHPVDVVNDAVQPVLKHDKEVCEAMKCVVACANKLNCRDDSIVEKCKTVKKNLAEDHTCNLDCDEGGGGFLGFR
mmetsp:Transcript_85065/g.134380  ORF Transcript_85065/g.134380 Transcript_85065/m.134380 type:complete len:129 (-) Transcript_85065:85-471(-)